MLFGALDLFDRIEDNDVRLKPRIVVSVDRIKELTMRRVHNNRSCDFDIQNADLQDTLPPTVRRPVRRIILIAAVLICFFTLTCCAVAATIGVGDLFKSYFSSRQESSLSDEQNQYIDYRTAAIGESVTQDGVTVTIKGAISDGTTAYIWVDIVAPDGINIESLPLGFDIEFEKLKLEGQEDDHISGISTSCLPVADNDGKENTASMLIEYNVYKLQGSNFTLADGRNRTLKLRNLFYHEKEYPYTLCTVAEGLWAFEFAFTAVDDEETELLTTPVWASYSQISGNLVQARINSIRIKGLSAFVYYSIDPSEVQEAGDLGVLKFVMKDGNIISAYPEKAGQAAQIRDGELIPDTEGHYCIYVFDAPVNYEDIVVLYIGEIEIVF